MGDSRKHVALVSLGCAKNLVDSEVMLGYLLQSGNYTLETDQSRADIIIVNTCGFIQPARDEAERHFQDALRIKRQRPHVTVVAAGCYVQKDLMALRQKFPQIDLWTGVNDFHHIVQLIEGKPYDPEESCFLYDHASPRQISTPPAWAYIKISEGCSHRCSFCTIPRIKGPYRSRSLESVLSEARRLADRGVKEVNLISQDSTYYGHDLGLKDGLAQLLEHLEKIPPLCWIRVLYSYPEEITDRLLDTMRAEKVCSYVDSPFQHADPTLVRRMRRGLDGTRALRLIAKIRERLPDAAIRTSLIVGFPGEGPSEFMRLKEFVHEAQFDHLGVFTYSHESDAPSASMQDEIPMPEKQNRRQEIMEIQAGISAKRIRRYVGARVPVLLEGRLQGDQAVLLGRTRYQAPEVDGVVLIPEAPLDVPAGTVQTVEILRSDVYDLYGKLI